MKISDCEVKSIRDMAKIFLIHSVYLSAILIPVSYLIILVLNNYLNFNMKK